MDVSGVSGPGEQEPIQPLPTGPSGTPGGTYAPGKTGGAGQLSPAELTEKQNSIPTLVKQAGEQNDYYKTDEGKKSLAKLLEGMEIGVVRQFMSDSQKWQAEIKKIMTQHEQ